MLQKINERVSGWIAWVIIILIAITFVLFGANYYNTRGQRGQVKMAINGEDVSSQDYESLYRRIRAQFQQFNLPASFIKKQTEQELVKTAVEKQSALKNGFFIASDQVRAAILTVPEFQENGEFSEKKFERVLASVQYTPTSFFDKIKMDLLARQQQFSITETNFTLPREAKELYQFLFQTRSYQSALFKKEAFLASIKVSDKEAKAYYQAHPDKFMSDEKVTLSYVSLSQSEIGKHIRLNEQELKKYYQENKASFIEPATFTVQHILISQPDETSESNMALAKKVYEKARAGDSFSALAKEYSADLLSDNGELPSGSLELFPKAFAEVLPSLKVGEISQPFASKDGVELIKLIATTPAHTLSFAKSKEKIKATLLKEKSQAEFASLGETLSDVSYQEPDSLVPVAEALSLKIKTLGPVSRDGAKEGLGANQKLLKSAFSKEQLSRGENSEPVQVEEDEVVVFRIKEHIKPTLLPFAEVKEGIEKTLKVKAATSMALCKAKELVSLIKAGDNEKVDAFMAAQTLSWQTVTGEVKTSQNKPTELQALAFALTSSEKSVAQKYLALQADPLKNGDAIVIGLTKLVPGDYDKLSSEERTKFQDQLAKTYGERDYAEYIGALIKKAKVEVF
jgi:peptidyl-prolyl cis-trans isomerase D